MEPQQTGYPTPAQPTSPPPTHHSNKRLYILLIVLMLFFLAVLGVLAYRPYSQLGVETPSSTPISIVENTGEPLGSLTIALEGSGDFLVTDPEGNRQGIDPETGNTYEEIAEGSYAEEFIAADQGIGEKSNVMKMFYTPFPLEGRYVIRVKPDNTMPYVLKILSYDRTGTPFEASVAGNNSATYSFIYSSDPNTSVAITLEEEGKRGTYPDMEVGQESRITMVEIYTDLKAHALVVDPNGAKEGFNGSKIVDEISDADYNFEQTIGNATGELPPPHPGDGNYSLIWNRPPEQFTLEVFPESDMYAFTVYITDQSGERTVIKRYEGTRKAGERIVYDIVYVPEQDFPLSVSRASVR